ncbi:MAG: NAD-dependent epimerase/dehydratase family protein [Gemmatimonadaceae bacterium]
MNDVGYRTFSSYKCIRAIHLPTCPDPLNREWKMLRPRLGTVRLQRNWTLNLSELLVAALTYYRSDVLASRIDRVGESLRGDSKLWLITEVGEFIRSNLLEHLLDLEQRVEPDGINVDGFFNIALVARETRVQCFVYVSSSAVDGDASAQPQREEVTNRPLSPYAAATAISECYAAEFELSYGVATVGLRYYNVFGCRQDPSGAFQGVIWRWIAKLLDDGKCEIFGDGATTRDFCHVANTVQAKLLAATVRERGATGQAYNIGASRSVTLNERASRGSIDMARALLGYSPTHDRAMGLAEIVPRYVARRMGDARVTIGPVQ